MTHSLHRRGDRESLKEDFVVLGCPSTGINKKGAAPKMRMQVLVQVRKAATDLGAGASEILIATTQQAAGASEQSAAISQATSTADQIRSTN